MSLQFVSSLRNSLTAAEPDKRADLGDLYVNARRRFMEQESIGNHEMDLLLGIRTQKETA